MESRDNYTVYVVELEPGGIDRVQQGLWQRTSGTFSGTTNVPIVSVNTNLATPWGGNCEIPGLQAGAAQSFYASSITLMKLTSSTNLNIRSLRDNDGANSVKGAWQVINWAKMYIPPVVLGGKKGWLFEVE